MKALQINPRTTEMTEDLLHLVHMYEDPPPSYIPDVRVGDTVKVFNHSEIVEMTVISVDNEGRELGLQDECGFRHLGSLWRWTEDSGDVFMTKASMRHKSQGAWNPSCCKKCSLVKLKKAA